MKPVPKSKKASTKKPKSHKKPLLILLALLTVAGMVGGVVAYTNYRNDQKQKEQAFAADKARFVKVEADMAEAYKGIVAKLGTPEAQSRNKSCSHISLKFQEGQLGCEINYHFSYVAQDYANAMEKIRSINDSVIAVDPFTLHAAYPDNVDIYNDEILRRYGEASLIELSYKREDGVDCSARISINQLTDRVHLNVDFGCYDDVYSRPVYTLAE